MLLLLKSVSQGGTCVSAFQGGYNKLPNLRGLNEINLLCHGTNSNYWLDCFLLDWGRIHSVFLSSTLVASGNSQHSIPTATSLSVCPSLVSSWVLSFLMLTCLIWLRVYPVTQDVPFRVYPSNSGCTYLKILVYSAAKLLLLSKNKLHSPVLMAAPFIMIPVTRS